MNAEFPLPAVPPRIVMPAALMVCAPVPLWKMPVPKLESCESAEPPADLRFATINAPGAQTYPISAVTFLLVYSDPCKAQGMDANKAKALVSWLKWGESSGQDVAKQLQYAPLPDSLKTKVDEKVTSVKCNGSAVEAAS